jgi:DNA mismatch repair ATPase MutS
MPVLVSHPDHTDCPVCEHSAIAGLGQTVPKSREEHERTCCSPSAIEGRKHLEDQAAEALEADRREREEEAKRRADMDAKTRMAVEMLEKPHSEQDAAWLASLEASKEHYRLLRLAEQVTKTSRFARLLQTWSWQTRSDRARIQRRLHPVPEFAHGDSHAAWFGDDDPTVVDLFSHAEIIEPTFVQRLRARFRR